MYLYNMLHAIFKASRKKFSQQQHTITAGKVVVSRQITWKVVSAAVSQLSASLLDAGSTLPIFRPTNFE